MSKLYVESLVCLNTLQRRLLVLPRKQDGITGWKARWGLFKYLTVSPGVVRRIFPAWLAYFKPGFHPWDHDDRALIGKYEGDYADALLPA